MIHGWEYKFLTADDIQAAQAAINALAAHGWIVQDVKLHSSIRPPIVVLMKRPKLWSLPGEYGKSTKDTDE